MPKQKKKLTLPAQLHILRQDFIMFGQQTNLHSNIYLVGIKLLITLIVFTSTWAFAAGGDEAAQIRGIFTISAGLSLAVSSSDFFNEYITTLNGLKNQFDTSPIVSISTKLNVFKSIRIGLSADYFRANFVDAYTQEIVGTTSTTTRSIGQQMIITTLPLLLSADWVPYQSQFRTYIGGSAGITFSSIYWKEDIASTNQYDIRKGGVHCDNSQIFPTLRLYTGVELGFDRESEDYFLGSLILEVNYTYVFRQVEMFQKIKKQFKEVPQSWNNDFEIITGYIGVNLAVSLNFKLKNLKPASR